MRPDPSNIPGRKRENNFHVRNTSRIRPLQRNISKKIYHYFSGFVFLVSILGVAVKYNDISQFINRPITKIKMQNQWQHVTEEEIKILLTGHMGTGFFRFNVNELKSLLENHPWVSEAGIKRLWPDSIAIQIEEHFPIAQWNENELLNQQGEIFQPERTDQLAILPQLFGPKDSQMQVMDQYQLFNQILFSSGLKLTGLTLTHRGSWSLTVNNSIQITVGRSELVSRLQRFVDFYERQNIRTTMDIVEVDLRYGNGIAIKNLTGNVSEVAVR